MKQVFFIHGGTTFKTHNDYLDFLRNRSINMGTRKGWNGDYLPDSLGEEVEFTAPRMPLKDNAKYDEWKLWFERHIPFMQDGIVFIGYSLGGIFLAQYLSENTVPFKIKHVYLVAAPFDDELTGEDLVGGFELGDDLTLLQTQAGNLTFMFSQDDETIHELQIEKYRTKLPDAEYITYTGKNGHFRTEEFPELVEMIKTDLT